MKRQERISLLASLFQRWSAIAPDEVTSIPFSGSHRDYFRLRAGERTAVGVYSEDRRENIAFASFTRHFRGLGLNVPELYAEDPDNNLYLLQDLGSLTLHDHIMKQPDPWSSDELPGIYRSVLQHLTRFQLAGLENFDYSVCVPRPKFDSQSVLWDLHYFKYYCLRLFGIRFDEQLLEDEFKVFSDYLASVDGPYFLYRDFQSRNIMLYEGNQYFIDYQGGRQGPLHYDLAALLYESRVNMPARLRADLLQHFLDIMGSRISVNEKEFLSRYDHFVLVRLLQALAAYGLRGVVENKGIFLASIPFALKNLEWLLSHATFVIRMPELTGSLERLIQSSELKRIAEHDTDRLMVEINSFSYKNGIPRDLSGHGGGFVFDCRALPNPGRIDAFKSLTGMDSPVTGFLEGKKEVAVFLEHVKKIIFQTVSEYRQRKFNRLMVSFGCTGGQHRSVFCAEKLRDFLNRNFDLKITVEHRDLL